MKAISGDRGRAAAIPWDAAAALFLLVGAWVHLRLYFDGYRDVPNANLGRSFLANVVVSVAVAAVLFVRPSAPARAAGALVAIGTLGAFLLSRTDTGIFGFTETGLNPSPEALLALVAELATLVLLAAGQLLGSGATPLPRRLSLAIVGLAIVVTALLGVVWDSSDDGGTTPAVASPGASSPAVSIVDFSFQPPTINVPVGGTVVWTNNDDFAHSVVADDATFNSGDMAAGATFSATFGAAGTTTYACGIHPAMKATVVAGS